jgi:hypothetical protein
MNKQEAVEIMATFIHNNNIEKVKAKGILDEQKIQEISGEKAKESFRETLSKLYDVMDEQGLIVKP